MAFEEHERTPRRWLASTVVVGVLGVAAVIAVMAVVDGSAQAPSGDVGEVLSAETPPPEELSVGAGFADGATGEPDAPATGDAGDAPAPSATVYFVDNRHPNASDDNPGTSEDAPLRSVVRAAAMVRAGETVYVKAGVYDDGDVVLANSGTADAPILIAAHPGHEHQAILTGEGLETIGASHVRISGFRVEDVSGVGIKVRGPEDPAAPPAVDIVVENNHTYDTCSSGIAVWGVEWGADPGDYDNVRDVTIRGNVVELANHGCYNEYITVANGVADVEVAYNTIRIGDASEPEGDEGIDFKNGVAGGQIHHNLIHDLVDTGIYIDGGRPASDGDTARPFVTDVSIYANYIFDVTKAGIAVVTEGPSDVDGIRVFNNVIRDTGRNGLSVYDHPRGADGVGTIRDVWFVNNTVHRGGLDGSWGGISIDHPDATGIVVRNNIAWDNTAFDIRVEPETTVEHNLCADAELCEITGAPGFVDPAAGDMRLAVDSPAIDAGTTTDAPTTDHTGQPRPRGAAVDLGAHEQG